MEKVDFRTDSLSDIVFRRRCECFTSLLRTAAESLPPSFLLSFFLPSLCSVRQWRVSLPLFSPSSLFRTAVEGLPPFLPSVPYGSGESLLSSFLLISSYDRALVNLGNAVLPGNGPYDILRVGREEMRPLVHSIESVRLFSLPGRDVVYVRG